MDYDRCTVLAYNLKRVISVIGITRTMKMMRLTGV